MSATKKAPWFVRQLSLYRDNKASPALKTARLLLRPLRYRDAKDFYAYAQDDQVARYVLWDAHTSQGQTRAILHSQIVTSKQENLCTMAIVRRDSNRMVGTIGLVTRDFDNLSAEVGFSLARDCWGQGLMTEALKAYLRYLFEHQGLHRIEAMHDELNPASGAVMQKAGMKAEGRLRERIYYKKRHASVILYACLREEWLKAHP